MYEGNVLSVYCSFYTLFSITEVQRFLQFHLSLKAVEIIKFFPLPPVNVKHAKVHGERDRKNAF
jgi:hypothetical protein